MFITGLKCSCCDGELNSYELGMYEEFGASCEECFSVSMKVFEEFLDPKLFKQINK